MSFPLGGIGGVGHLLPSRRATAQEGKTGSLPVTELQSYMDLVY